MVSKNIETRKNESLLPLLSNKNHIPHLAVGITNAHHAVHTVAGNSFS